jgi:hypothetical protein
MLNRKLRPIYYHEKRKHPIASCYLSPSVLQSGLSVKIIHALLVYSPFCTLSETR